MTNIKRSRMKIVSMLSVMFFIFSIISSFGGMAVTAESGTELTNVALNKPVSIPDGDTARPDFSPEKAVDGIGGDWNNGWAPKLYNDVSPWLQIDLEDTYVIHRVEIDDRPYDGIDGHDDWDGPRKNFEVRASNDPNFATYSVLGAVGSEPYEGYVWTHNVTDTEAYRYIRYTRTDTGYTWLSEIRVFGILEEREEDTTSPTWPQGSSLTTSDISSTGVTLAWTAAIDDTAVTGYRIYKDSELIKTVAGSVYNYDVIGLDAETEYIFKVEAGDAAGNWSEDGPTVTAITLAPSNTDVLLRIFAASDTHSALHNEKVANMAKDINGNNCDALVLSGDLTNDAAAMQYDALISIINNNLDTKRTQVFYATGNHDVRFLPGGFTEARELFLEKTGMPDVYYDTWIKGYHIIVMAGEKDLQNDASISNAQFEWLETKLAEGTDANKPIFLFIHQPINLMETAQQQQRLRSILAQYPQVIYTYGHTHGNVNTSNNVKFEECTYICNGAVTNNQAIIYEVYSDRVEVIARNTQNKTTLRTDIVSGPKTEWINRELAAIDNILDNAVIGNENGQYPLWTKEYLDKVVLDAENYISSGNTTQEGLGNTFNSLRVAKTAFEKAKNDSMKEPEVFTASGNVYNELQQPVVGTVIEIYAAGNSEIPLGTAVTGVDGYYTLPSQVSGEYIVKAKYYTESIDLVIPFMNVNNFDITVNSSSLTDVTAPEWSDGSALTAEVESPTKVMLEWGTATDDIEVTCYKIYESSNLIAVVPGNVYSYTVTGLNPDTSYIFIVKAGDGSNNTTEEGLTTTAKTWLDTEAPIWPDVNALTVIEKTIDSITLSWTQAVDDTGVTSYKIYKDAELIATVGSEVNSYKITGLDIETEYTFLVQAGDAFDNWSEDGPTVTEATPTDTTPPTWVQTSSLLGSNLKSTSITLDWTDAFDDTGVMSYRIYEGSNLLDTVDATVNRYYVTGLTQGTNYTFTVQAGDGYGNWSEDGPTTTAIPGPNIALNKTYSSGEGKDYLVWNGIEFGPDKAFDDGPFEGQEGYLNGWSGESAVWSKPKFPAWLQVDLHKEHMLNRIELVDRPNDPYTGERHRFEIRASNDPEFKTYDVLVKAGDGVIPNDSTFVVFVTSDKSYRYVRYQKTGGEYAFITEMRVYGYDADKDTTAPEWPDGSDITVSNLSSTGTTLTWPVATDDTAVIGYKIYKDSELIDTVAGSVNSYNVTGLTAETEYIFTVQAFDPAGNESIDGPAVTITTTSEETQQFTIGKPIFKDAEGNIMVHLAASTDLRASIDITNNLEEPQNACFIVALYGPDNALKLYSAGEGIMQGNHTITFKSYFPLPDDVTGYYVKVLVWDSLEGMIPISNAVIFE